MTEKSWQISPSNEEDKFFLEASDAGVPPVECLFSDNRLEVRWSAPGGSGELIYKEHVVDIKRFVEQLVVSLERFTSQGYVLEDALTLALSYCASDRSKDEVLFVPTLELLPETSISLESNTGFTPVDPSKMTLYPVVDSVDWVKRLIGLGIQTLQLRIKSDLSEADREQMREVIQLAKEREVQLFINDHWQTAIELGAFGVHLGQEDLLEADLAKIADAGLRLGISTHGYYEIARAVAIAPSYVALGHIFPTRTKDMPSAPQGLERLARYQQLLQGAFPTVAIGGISKERVAPVKATGVDSIALVTAITEAVDPDSETRSLMQLASGESDAA